MITHPFHPLHGHTFPLLSRRFAWGEARVQYLDPVTAQIGSVPLAWTNLASMDSFTHIAAGRALLRMEDLQLLNARLNELVPSETDLFNNNPNDSDC